MAVDVSARSRQARVRSRARRAEAEAASLARRVDWVLVGAVAARVEALDRRRLLPLPALGVREAALRPLPGRLPRRPLAAARGGRSAHDADGARARPRADRARLPAAGLRDGARLRRRARRGAL